MDAYNDITPRVGIAWDVFGNGRTALKASIGKYLEGVGTSGNYAGANPTSRMPVTGGVFATGSVNRSWTDNDGDFVPDCDLLNNAANSVGGDTCGPVSNARFGQNVLTNNFDPDLLKGWGVRPSDWGINVAVQQQILPRASVEIAYSRRSFKGFTVTDNLATTPANYQTFSITAPLDPRLPDGGGYAISNLKDVDPTLFSTINNLLIDSKSFGDWYWSFNGFDFSVSVRMPNGLNFQGGTSTGQNVADNCAVRDSLPELNAGIGPGLVGSTVSQTSPYCHVAYGWLTQFRGLASYTIPKVDVQVSGVMQSKPGSLLAANYAVPAAQITQALGRPQAGGGANLTINLIEPGSMYGNRVNQLDFRVAKILKFGTTKTMVGLDLYNALNSGAILTYNNAFVPGGPWLQPISILTGRMAKISAEFTF